MVISYFLFLFWFFVWHLLTSLPPQPQSSSSWMRQSRNGCTWPARSRAAMLVHHRWWAARMGAARLGWPATTREKEDRKIIVSTVEWAASTTKQRARNFSCSLPIFPFRSHFSIFLHVVNLPVRVVIIILYLHYANLRIQLLCRLFIWINILIKIYFCKSGQLILHIFEGHTEANDKEMTNINSWHSYVYDKGSMSRTLLFYYLFFQRYLLCIALDYLGIQFDTIFFIATVWL